MNDWLPFAAVLESESWQHVWQQSLKMLEDGGIIMMILLGLSLAAVTLVFMKIIQFASLRLGSRTFIDQALDHWGHHHPELALKCLHTTPHPIARVLEAAIKGLSHPETDESLVREDVLRVAARQNQLLHRYFRGLDMIATLAPLLGLLGTVLGMINAFQALEAAGGRADPAHLAGGIWEALLTTAFGLTVAIPASAALHGLESIAERTRCSMEDAVTRLFTRTVQHPPASVLSGQPPAAIPPQVVDHAH